MVMVFTGGEIPYSIEDCGAYPYASGTPGALVDVVGIFKVDTKSAVTSAEVRGDNQVLATASSYDSADVTLEIHQWHLLSLAAVAGGTYSTSGTTPATINKLLRLSTDTVADYKLAAQSHSKDAQGGGFRFTWWRCQWQGGPDYNFDDSTFPAINVTAKAVPDGTNQIWQVEQYETFTPLA